ncbi:hypothetical protein K474DRAFT_1741752 [Panus rudis PR-1116 ss-1]|nr:hypothetical protein K474DRAFT_1741752 [Panus rudis PR-1116 ss-1]
MKGDHLRLGLYFGLISLSSHVFSATTNLTSLVNLFISTASGANGGSGGNAFPGAAIPFAMAKVGIDVDTAPRQAGYIADNSSITGISLMHDEGTGGNTNGGYGIFPLFPLTNCSFTSCPVGLDARKAKRAAGADVASPGYFATTFVNGLKLEATSTRRAGLIRFTYPDIDTSKHVVVDLTHDLQRSFEGGGMNIDQTKGQVQLQGTFLQSYGTDNYTVFACYDFAAPASASNQSIIKAGTFRSSPSSSTNITVAPGSSSLTFPFTSSPTSVQAGALLSFDSPAGTVLTRFGVSFMSPAQACENAEQEIPAWDWDAVQTASRSAWETILERIQMNVDQEDSTVVELLYSSLYRTSLVPANLTLENPYWAPSAPFFDALFCSWDTFRTVHPLLSLTSPYEWADIVSSYIDGWRNTGYIPECRANTKAGYVQSGSDGMPILGDFAVKYADHAEDLRVNTDDLYQALVDTAENTPPDWYRVGRQNTAWKQFGYIPTAWVDPSGATGLATREASRSLEYAFNDFAVRQAGLALGKGSEDIEKYGNRSLGFKLIWDPNVTSDGFTGFAQRRFANGTFAFSPPDACSPVDPTPHSCARGTDNNVGFYESSSWEMSFFAPHSMSSIVSLMGGPDTFIQRVDNYFSKGYFQAGNEPSFAIPWAYHYVGRPDLSALRVRNVVYKNFGTGIGGIPGNDDSGAMAALLTFHIIGLYPIPATRQFLVGSPMVSSYVLHNGLFNTSTNITVVGFDRTSLTSTPPTGSRLFIKSIAIDGAPSESLCFISFETLTGGGHITIEVDGDASAAAQRGCGADGGGLPDSLESGGF